MADISAGDLDSLVELDPTDLVVVSRGGAVLATGTVAEIVEMAGGEGDGISADFIAGLTVQANADLTVQIPVKVASLMRQFAFNLRDVQRIIDLDVQTRLGMGDYLRVWGDGGWKRIAATDLLQSIGGVLDITQAPYNCVGDGKEVRDVTVLSGNLNIYSATSLWTLEDVGKDIWLGDKSRAIAFFHTTIAGFVDNEHIVLTAAPGFTATNIVCAWGTDNTAGLQAAYQDAGAPEGEYNVKGKAVIHPPGAYMTNNLFMYPGSTLFGYSGRTCYLMRIPSASTQPTLQNHAESDRYPIITDLGIYGLKQLQTGVQRGYYYNGPSGASDIIPFPLWQGIWIWETSGDGFVQADASGGVMSKINIADCGGLGYKSAAFDMLSDAVYISGCSAGGAVWTSAANANSMSNWKISYNGRNPFNNDATHLDTGMGLYNAGEDNIFTNIRIQETWADGWVEAGKGTVGRGIKIEDAGNIRSRLGQGPVPSRAKARAYIHLLGCIDCDMEFNTSYAIPFGHATLYGTHCLFMSDPGGVMEDNDIRIRPRRNMKLSGQYYAPVVADAFGVQSTTGDYAAALYGDDIAGTISATNNITIKGVSVI